MESDLSMKCYLPDEIKLQYNPQETIHLDDMQDDEEGILVKLDIGERELMRLCHLGLTPGVRVRKMQSAPFNGPIKIEVRGTILALGRGIARRMLLAKVAHTYEREIPA